MKSMKTKLVCLVTAVLFLSACGSAGGSKSALMTEGMDAAMAPQESYDYAAEEEYYDEYDNGYDSGTEGTFEDSKEMGTNVPQSADTQIMETNRKLIKTVNLSVETQEFDKLLGTVENKTAEYGGYIEQLYTYNGSIYNSSRSYKNASLTLRIPKENLDDFLTEVGKAGNITSRTESVEDVTLTYVDMESHKKVLLAEQERLLSFLEQAQTIEEIITIESRLSDVRYQIESMESQLRTYDNLVDYSTVYLEINEVAVLTPVEEEQETIWERMGSGFMNSVDSLLHELQELFVGFVVILPYLLFILLVILAIVGIVVGGVKLGMKKNNKKNTKKGAKEPAKAE